ncbi:MAG: sugar transferase, partial [Paracoccaceae bacterium]
MYDFEMPFKAVADFDRLQPKRKAVGFFAAKRAFDIVVSILLLPILIIAAIALLVLNPYFNRGPLFYVQTRMGQHCKAFKVLKFRSMTDVPVIARGADDPLELDRITRLGHFLRKSRVDELPQIFNVLRGQMSLIGPRPDFFHHARRYVRTIPGYKERHSVRPGISGLAQTALGYAEGNAARVAKARADLYYIEHASL